MVNESVNELFSQSVNQSGNQLTITLLSYYSTWEHGTRCVLSHNGSLFASAMLHVVRYVHYQGRQGRLKNVMCNIVWDVTAFVRFFILN